MKTLKKLTLIGISLLFAAGLAACEKPGPAETVGKKMDQTVDQAGKKTGEAADTVGEKLEK